MQSLSWQKQLAQSIRHPADLLEFVGLGPSLIGYSRQAITQFSVKVPHAFAKRIKKNDPNDPILRQIFPYKAEDDEVIDYVNDPLAELNIQPEQGLLQKYNNRVLLITTGACAVHCRYCFRRHYPYQESSATSKHWQASLEHIKNDSSIEEVILSGGDPLTLSDQRLEKLCSSLATIKHIKRIRFHTRLPVVIPARITTALLNNITGNGQSIIFVIHTNHANELDNTVSFAIKRLQEFGILVLNQSVLLKGINDSVETLIHLSEQLIENNVVPYYLHMLDPIAGGAHYDIPLKQAQEFIQDMQDRVSGYLIPKLVKEEIGTASKTSMTDQVLSKT